MIDWVVAQVLLAYRTLLQIKWAAPEPSIQRSGLDSWRWSSEMKLLGLVWGIALSARFVCCDRRSPLRSCLKPSVLKNLPEAFKETASAIRDLIGEVRGLPNVQSALAGVRLDDEYQVRGTMDLEAFGVLGDRLWELVERFIAKMDEPSSTAKDWLSLRILFACIFGTKPQDTWTAGWKKPPQSPPTFKLDTTSEELYIQTKLVQGRIRAAESAAQTVTEYLSLAGDEPRLAKESWLWAYYEIQMRATPICSLIVNCERNVLMKYFEAMPGEEFQKLKNTVKSAIAPMLTSFHALQEYAGEALPRESKMDFYRALMRLTLHRADRNWDVPQDDDDELGPGGHQAVPEEQGHKGQALLNRIFALYEVQRTQLLILAPEAVFGEWEDEDGVSWGIMIEDGYHYFKDAPGRLLEQIQTLDPSGRYPDSLEGALNTLKGFGYIINNFAAQKVANFVISLIEGLESVDHGEFMEEREKNLLTSTYKVVVEMLHCVDMAAALALKRPKADELDECLVQLLAEQPGCRWQLPEFLARAKHITSFAENHGLIPSDEKYDWSASPLTMYAELIHQRPTEPAQAAQAVYAAFMRQGLAAGVTHAGDEDIAVPVTGPPPFLSPAVFAMIISILLVMLPMHWVLMNGPGSTWGGGEPS